MEEVVQKIQALYHSFFQRAWDSFQKIPQSGGDRMYFRIFYKGQTVIATYNLNIQENQTFIYFASHFFNKGLPVPKVLAVSEDGRVYLQEDLGTTSLLTILEEEGKTERVYGLFKKSVQALAKLQVTGSEGLDYSNCLTSKEFGKNAVLTDLLYYKYYFLDTLQYPYDKQALIDEFELISAQLAESHFNFFMFRDFQSRNIIVQEEEVYFIDFQGGMKGGLPYDLASLLWQAKAGLSNEWKERLLEDYLEALAKLLPARIDKQVFIQQYNGFILLRLLQVLGAYGFRGLFERKAHFLTSIPLGLQNVKTFLQTYTLNKDTPVFAAILNWMVGDTVIARFTPPLATANTLLKVTVNSFSYKKGIPQDMNENGGGFVFDMRGILNPGRIEQYKKLSGLNKPVQDYLEQHTKMNTFLNSVWDLIDITVENYMSRDFESLQINFGCTGGQHRSVYAAEQTARHLRNKYKLEVVIAHHNKENWVQ